MSGKSTTLGSGKMGKRSGKAVAVTGAKVYSADPSEPATVTTADREQQQALLERLRRDAHFLAERFKLELRSLDGEGPRVKRRYGICYDDGSIRVRLRNVRNGELLKYSALVDTMCHELAHLRHFNHGVQFQTLYRRILEYSRRQGIYRPTPRGRAPLRFGPRPEPIRPTGRAEVEPVPRGPLQLELFPAAAGRREGPRGS